MRLPLFVTCWLLLVGTAFAPAPDLIRVDRTLKKEPAYQTQPKYVLLVFGPAAATRAWLVLDGKVLYLDRFCNGDLTEPGDRVELFRAIKRDQPNNPLGELREFADFTTTPGTKSRNTPTLKTTTRYSQFLVEQDFPRKDYTPPNTSIQRQFDHMRPDFLRINICIEGRLWQDGYARLADHPQEAPVLHFDGPLTLGFHPYTQPLVRGQTVYLMVQLITPGQGENAYTLTACEWGIPAEVHPVAEIEFPAKNPGGEPTTTRVVLSHRC